MNNFSFRERMRIAAEYLISRRNPADGGWGLNIEKSFQGSSIVNTAESLFVINRAGCWISNPEKTTEYLRVSIREHPNSRGDYLRYLTFGLWGLLEAGLPVSDPSVVDVARQIESRIVGHSGWGELQNDADVRIWPTFQSLWMLGRVFGREYVTNKY